ncbi:MAG: lysophospholipid acyltransferase family protein [Flavobacteriales bacterium]|nr:lysophospholipid acyltransferase family protein [Flavobacteriales bacterium]
MSRIAYYLLLKPISLLPYFLLYRLSDFFFLVFITVFPYRKKVALGNIQRVFPKRSEKEQKKILRDFYRHLADIIVESFKNFSISEKQANARMKAVNNEFMADILNSGQGIVLCGGHYNNWELYAVAGAAHMPKITMAIYKRLSDQFLDGVMRETRGRFGLHMIPTKEASEWMKNNASAEAVTSIYAIDQSPANPKKSLWMDFLGQDTAMYYGPEKHARTYNMAVVFGEITKLKRGHYQIEYKLVTRDPNSYEKGGVIKEVNQILEKQIQEAPAYWLWTHKRWKHKRPE